MFSDVLRCLVRRRSDYNPVEPEVLSRLRNWGATRFVSASSSSASSEPFPLCTSTRARATPSLLSFVCCRLRVSTDFLSVVVILSVGCEPRIFPTYQRVERKHTRRSRMPGVRLRARACVCVCVYVYVYVCMYVCACVCILCLSISVGCAEPNVSCMRCFSPDI